MTDVTVARALAALRVVDATTGATIVTPLTLSAPGTKFVRNRRGLYVLTRCELLPGYHNAFPDAPRPPDAPAVGNVPLTLAISDRSRRYLARSVVVRLPRDPDPANSAAASSVFRELEVPLYPSPVAPSDPGWAGVRVSVRATGTGVPLSRTFLRVHRAGAPSDVLGRGLADARGEAFVPIAGVPTANWSSDPERPVLVTSLAAVLTAVFDPDASDPPDPADIEARAADLPSSTINLELASGRESIARVEITLP